MSIDYRAIIRNDRVAWEGEMPPELREGQSVRATIRLVGESDVDDQARGERMAAALQKIAAIDKPGLPSSPDQWQREVREDRPIPGR